MSTNNQENESKKKAIFPRAFFEDQKVFDQYVRVALSAEPSEEAKKRWNDALNKELVKTTFK
jgi:hypothetical protein